MRKVWVVLGLLLALIGGMLVLAQSTNNANIVIPESAFVRVAPSKSAVPIGTLRAGDSVRPVNLSEDGMWVLIVYRRGFGWVQRGLVAWADERALEALPVLPENATPTAEASPSSTLVPPTYTPVGHYLALENAAKAFVRSGPSQSYARLGELPNGATVEPVGRNADTTWILIRFQDAPSGFGWIGRWLVRWQDANALQTLPVLLETALTPSPTFTPVTPSATPSRTHTPTSTATATDVPTATPTATDVPTSTATATDVPTSTPTATDVPTSTPTATDVPTSTPTATDVPTSTPTATDVPTSTATATDVPTATPTATDVPTSTATATDVPTATPTATDVPTATPTATDVPTSTATATDVPTSTATATDVPTSTATATDVPTSTPTATDVPTSTATATDVPTSTPTATDVPTSTATATDVPTSTATATDVPTSTATATDVPTSTATKQSEIMLPATAVPTPVVSADDDGKGGGIRPETVLAIVVVLVLAAYVVLYLLLAMNAAKPAPAFLSKPCPVCQRGTLYLETKTEQVLGLPVVRRTVRCNTCRSLLRQTRRGRWRYAVDRLENPTLYARYNARELSDTQLLTLGREASRAVRPEFIEEDNV